MQNDKNILSEFRDKYENIFYDILKKSPALKNEEADCITYALHDISESIEKIYQRIIPKFLEPNLTEDKLKDLIFDIKSEFDHVLYHVEDAKLYNFKGLGQ